jgi:hypothetical protein
MRRDIFSVWTGRSCASAAKQRKTERKVSDGRMEPMPGMRNHHWW